MRDVNSRRPTQAERSARTRARILDATIRCLHDYGYTATTTLLVAEKSGLSRGAMLHQFPTMTDLMLYVVQSVHEQDIARYKKHMESGAESSDLFHLGWEMLSNPSGVAVLEILQGSRSDPQLREKLLPIESQIEKRVFEFAAGLFKDDSELHAPAAVRLVLWTFRGLSIAQFLNSPREIKQVLNFMERLYTTFQDAERQKGRPVRSKRQSRAPVGSK